jgi:hypothetical protein
MVCHSFRFGKARQSASSRGIRATRRGGSQRAELLQQEVCALIKKNAPLGSGGKIRRNRTFWLLILSSESGIQPGSNEPWLFHLGSALAENANAAPKEAAF